MVVLEAAVGLGGLPGRLTAAEAIDPEPDDQGTGNDANLRLDHLVDVTGRHDLEILPIIGQVNMLALADRRVEAVVQVCIDAPDDDPLIAGSSLAVSRGRDGMAAAPTASVVMDVPPFRWHFDDSRPSAGPSIRGTRPDRVLALVISAGRVVLLAFVAFIIGGTGQDDGWGGAGIPAPPSLPGRCGLSAHAQAGRTVVRK